jgi:hypothetical protein
LAEYFFHPGWAQEISAPETQKKSKKHQKSQKKIQKIKKGDGWEAKAQKPYSFAQPDPKKPYFFL